MVPRTAAVPEFKQSLEAPAREADRPPIVVVSGPQGMGKTTFLRQLEDKLGHRTPRALIACERYSKDEIPQLLSDIKRQLGRHCPAIGRLRFRRLEIGLVSIRTPANPDGNPRRAQRRLIDSVIHEFYAHPNRIGDSVGGATSDVASGVPLLQTLLGWVVVPASRLLSRRLLLWLLRRPWKWWGHRDQQRHDEAIDVLEGLNNGWRDESLIEALLADVRATYGRGRLARSGWYNVVVLLDNADTEVGNALLKHLNALRTELQIANVAVEPLLIVATSSKPLFGGSLKQRPMPEFTEPETEWLVKDLLDGTHHRFAKVLHQFTSGYPATAAAITTAAARHPAALAAGLDVLLATHLDDDEKNVEQQEFDELTNTLLRLPSHDELDNLATCAAARTQRDADWLGRNHVHSTVIGPRFLFETGLWNESDRTGAHQVLRRLLLRRLARTSAERSTPDWSTTFRLLSDLNRRRGDLADELYYLLALGEFDAVVHRLAECLPGRAREVAWLELLQFVTKAPRRSRDDARGTRSPYEQQVALAGTVVDDGTSHLRETARLVAGLWLANDPSTSPDRRDLHEQIVLDYKQIAPDTDRPMDVQSEADRHKALAHDWS